VPKSEGETCARFRFQIWGEKPLILFAVKNEKDKHKIRHSWLHSCNVVNREGDDSAQIISNKLIIVNKNNNTIHDIIYLSSLQSFFKHNLQCYMKKNKRTN